MTFYTRKRTLMPEPQAYLPSPPPSSSPRCASVEPSITYTPSCPSTAPPTTAPRARQITSTPQRQKRLIQTRIDLGGPAHVRCRACGMSYTPSSPEDASIHRRFHAALSRVLMPPKRALDGCEVLLSVPRARVDERMRKRDGPGGAPRRLGTASPGKRRRALDDATRTAGSCFASAADRIMRVRPNDGRTAKNFAEKALEVVEEELGAVKTTREALWGAVAADKRPGAGSTRRKRCEDEGDEDDAEDSDKENASANLGPGAAAQEDCRTAVCLYMHDNRCAGLLLTAPISRAREVLPSPPQPGAPPDLVSDLPSSDPAFTTIPAASTSLPVSSHTQLQVSDFYRPAEVGVARIWVAPELRRAGVASALLDAAGLGKSMEMVAFSQPTEAGARLARSWFGRDAGWMVY